MELGPGDPRGGDVRGNVGTDRERQVHIAATEFDHPRRPRVRQVGRPLDGGEHPEAVGVVRRGRGALAEREATVAELDDGTARHGSTAMLAPVDEHRQPRRQLRQFARPVVRHLQQGVMGLHRGICEHHPASPGAPDEMPAGGQLDRVPGMWAGGDGDAHTRVWTVTARHRNAAR